LGKTRKNLLQRTVGSRFFEGFKQPPGIIKIPGGFGQLLDFLRTAIIYDIQVVEFLITTVISGFFTTLLLELIPVEGLVHNF
jgi:hypothetical protein